MLKQSQQQKLLQRLSPQQIQLMKLLQVPTVNLEERIKDEMEENPALEYATEEKESDGLDLKADSEHTDDDYETEDIELTNDASDKVDLDDFIKSESDDGGSDYGYDGDYYNQNEERISNPVRVESTFHEYLLDQLRMLYLDEREQKIAEQIIGSIDEDGYLRREPSSMVDDLVFSQNVVTDENEVKFLVSRIQLLDPPGVAAWTLQECLLLQLRRMPQSKPVKDATKILDGYFNEFTKKHYDKIQRHLDITEQDIKGAVGVDYQTKPKPGGTIDKNKQSRKLRYPRFFYLQQCRQTGAKPEL